MGITKIFNRKTKKVSQADQKDFEGRLDKFLKKMNEVSTEFRIQPGPCIGKYGAELEFRDVPKKSNIITK